jgi:hypothetical protein
LSCNNAQFEKRDATRRGIEKDYLLASPLGRLPDSRDLNPAFMRLNAELALAVRLGRRTREPPTQTRCSRFSTSTLTPPPPPPFLRGAYFGPTSSVPKMDLSPSTLRITARGIYRAVSPTGLRPRLPLHRRPPSSGVHSLFSGTQASSHERTTIAAPPCPSSSTLD